MADGDAWAARARAGERACVDALERHLRRDPLLGVHVPLSAATCERLRPFPLTRELFNLDLRPVSLVAGRLCASVCARLGV